MNMEIKTLVLNDEIEKIQKAVSTGNYKEAYMVLKHMTVLYLSVASRKIVSTKEDREACAREMNNKLMNIKE